MDSEQLFNRGKQVIPGGVNSPVRAFNSVGGTPIYMQKGKGAILTSVEGKEYTDYCCSWGPLILGHARKEVIEAIYNTAINGTTFGTNTQLEVEFAEYFCSLVPYIEMIRLVSSGTEAVMTALRLAKGVTKREKIIKFAGGYHGHSDSLLVSAGSGLLTSGITSSAGVSANLAKQIFIPEYNNLEQVEEIIKQHGSELAAIIVEPIAGNMGMIPPKQGFLQGLRKLADSCGALLIFDEVITGFRIAPTTFGTICEVTPDITCFGKIIGGGLPIGGIGANKTIMENLSPTGEVYQAGTLSGNPVAVAAGLTTLKLLKKDNPYEQMSYLSTKLASGINRAAQTYDIEMHCASFAGIFTPFFCKEPVKNLHDAKQCDTQAHAKFFHAMLEVGIYLPPSQFETAFISAAHSEDDIDLFIKEVEQYFATIHNAKK